MIMIILGLIRLFNCNTVFTSNHWETCDTSLWALAVTLQLNQLLTLIHYNITKVAGSAVLLSQSAYIVWMQHKPDYVPQQSALIIP